ncbi:DUF3828 domain-containing protein [Enterobacter adelaidei]
MVFHLTGDVNILFKLQQQRIYLKVYLRNEDGKWKIYRVTDMSHHFEQYIFLR